MEEILIDGERYAIPEGKTADDIYAQVKGLPSTAPQSVTTTTDTSGGYNYSQRPASESWLGDLDQNTLTADRDWLYASGRLYKMDEGKEFKGSAQELADYGLSKMGYFNYNLGSMTLDTAALAGADMEDRKAFLYLMETYDELAPSLRGTGRALKGMATDPTNIGVLASLGFGFLGQQGAKTAGKSAIKMGIKEAIKAGVVTAGFSAADDAMRQTVERSVHTDQEFDTTRNLTSAAIGGTIGAVLGGGAAGLATAAANRKAAKAVANAVTPPAAVTQAVTPQGVVNAATPSPTAVAQAVTPPTGVTGSLPAQLGTPDQIVDSVFQDLAARRKNPAHEILQSIKDAVSEDGWKITPAGRSEISARTQEAVQLLSTIASKDANIVEKVIRKARMTPAQQSALKETITQSEISLRNRMTDVKNSIAQVKDPALRQQYENTLTQLEQVHDKVASLDIKQSSGSGTDLANRANRGAVTGSLRDFYSVDKILEDNPTFTRQQARDLYDETFAEHLARQTQTDEVRAVTAQMDVANEAGDIDQVIALAAQRDVLQKAAIADQKKELSMLQKFNDSDFNKAANEVLGGLIFSPATIGVNLVVGIPKTFTKPLLRALVDSNASVRSTLVSYDVMRKSTSVAFKYARQVWEMEKSSFYSKQADFFGAEPTIPGALGRVARFWTTGMEVIDGAIAQIAYRGFLAAQDYDIGAQIARNNGVAKELVHKEALDYVEKMQAKAFRDVSGDLSATEEAIRVGTRKGYKGNELATYVKNTLANNKEYFQRAARPEGRSYVEELVFRNSFEGKTLPSRFAKGIEQNFAGNIFFRVFMQAFFRAPIRIFEEGLRLTPGMNFVTPGFLSDLRGLNGSIRQVRAQGEAMLSLGLGASVMTMYANGMITGSGQGNYKQLKNKQNTGDWEPYTIYFPNGSKLSYRNLDPIGTPLKIIVNAMEAYEKYDLQKKQGEYTDEFGNDLKGKETIAWTSMAFMPLVRAVKDASVTEGLNQLFQFGEWMNDPEGQETAIESFLTEKAKMVIPNTYFKSVQAFGGPVDQRAPSGIENGILAKINPWRDDVPVQRDLLGNEMTMDTHRAALTGVGFNTQIAAKGISDQGKAVAVALSELEYVSGTSFDIPFKFSSLGNQDTRKIYLKDGKTTWYDAIYDIYRDLKPEQELYQVLIEGKDFYADGRPSGNSGKGTKTTAVREILSRYREAAIKQFLMDTPEAMDIYQRVQENKFTTAMGGYDL